MELLDRPIGEIASEMPGATRIFHAYKLDFCCGGDKPLREAAAKRGVDADTLATELAALKADDGARDWRNASNTELIEHILQRFHNRHREQLPELLRLARRVEAVHGEKADCPVGLADLLETMQQELTSHMMKEEQILFPMLLRGSAQMAQGPISVMRFEHDQHGDALAQLTTLTHDITPPSNACNTWRALYAGLAELREDLMQHIHLENNILFLRG